MTMIRMLCFDLIKSILFILLRVWILSVCLSVCLSGSSIADQIIEVLLSTSMFVGGFVGFVLDNLLPGQIRSSFITFSFSYLCNFK